MISLTIAKKYSRALFEIGQKEGNFEILGKELKSTAEFLTAQKELKGLLFSVVYPVAIRKAIFKATSQPLNLSKTMMDFVDLLIARERINHLPEIAKTYENLCNEVANRIRATLFTAKPLSANLLQDIKQQLASTTGKEIILAVEERPTLIGGVVAQIGNLVYDGSLKTQLLRMKENLYKE